MAWFDLVKRITAKNENVGQSCLKKHLNQRNLVKYYVIAISRNSNRFLMGIERSLSQKEIIKVYEIFQLKSSSFIIFIQNGIKWIRINLLIKQKILEATVRTAFSWFPLKQKSSYTKKSKFADESWQPRKVIQVIITWNRKITWQFEAF